MPAAKGDFFNDQRITLRNRPGPETPEMARRYDMLEDGMTVGEALQRFTWRGLRGLGRRRYLRKLLEHRNISIT